ncbi:Uncharacterized conserved protein YecE, DUF72 family [Thalassobacillus cyri]|uniref:Uncharacterized conserved protein YecE, DUF72 family n=1 Tax=Thalassobacillus cyri TaxID=571932 RepID=A0A1H4CT14_9BACI|nr:DUF72 domain-containing protein [Thalassobacillus cyri]SEA63459.1 Uncharacterized conserved protein YecE, DUF72 family [Thalassobacillus cyri]
MSIKIGVTGWGDHDLLYDDRVASGDKLSAYASHFPVVEVDTAFYAIQPEKNYRKWLSQTPENFSFVIKAYQKLTGHDRDKLTIPEAKALMEEYRESIQPVVEAGKLNALLFQFPPWFDVRKAHIKKLKTIREWLSDLPLALEFRNQSWFDPKYKQQTLDFMKEEKWIHTIVDEPQAGENSVPTILEPTHPEKTLIRFHGRNVHGWNRNGREGKDWRAVRFLYRYNEQELREWVEHLKKLQQQTKEITIFFNNNSGGDAAANAKQLIDMLDINYENLNPRQMDLFNF